MLARYSRTSRTFARTHITHASYARITLTPCTQAIRACLARTHAGEYGDYGISKLTEWPILQVRYLGCKSMKLKKSSRVFNSMISTFHVPFRNASLFRIFYEIENLKVNVVKVRIRKCWGFMRLQVLQINISFEHFIWFFFKMPVFIPLLMHFKKIKKKWSIETQNERKTYIL